MPRVTAARDRGQTGRTLEQIRLVLAAGQPMLGQVFCDVYVYFVSSMHKCLCEGGKETGQTWSEVLLTITRPGLRFFVGRE